ncbi:hypothetical protein KsCSTR_19960 [Candidatus Kuenenia stuttgartiensis]|uniref:Uncharacterized protein n=1 Tax=Kuenenia stuttgartiensis TaxID=174633 RepID=Q1Q2M5_KUEST|nr:hypothetical protein KsCSTR_19960 [Candidatus Kuenenia stuttgartiensis]CAJ74274.1 unknown protein [Candidatus Kuenenia stuttgartiensis]
MQERLEAAASINIKSHIVLVVSLMRLLDLFINHTLVLIVSTYPNPNIIFTIFNRKCPMIHSDSG